MNITVYLGANEGNDLSLRKAVEELGAWIGNSGNALVYGGSKSGLMGAIADSVLKAGGEVTGVEPQFFIEKEFQHDAGGVRYKNEAPSRQASAAYFPANRKGDKRGTGILGLRIFLQNFQKIRAYVPNGIPQDVVQIIFLRGSYFNIFIKCFIDLIVNR